VAKPKKTVLTPYDRYRKTTQAGLSDAEVEAYIKQAHKEYHHDGEVEVDDNAVVSHSDGGAYVLAGVWVSDEDALPKDE
jgi:hypothetical protein